ncbi:N-6 DNA methylase [Vibrio astriarenae]
MNQELLLKKLESFLWKTASTVDVQMDLGEFKDYLFRLLFLKRISDVFEEEREKLVQLSIASGGELEHERDIAENDCDQYTFFIPKTARWSVLSQYKDNLGENLNKAAIEIETHNPFLEGIFTSFDFSSSNKLTDSKLCTLMSYLNNINLRNENLGEPELLGAVFESLLKKFADSSGKKGKEFFTPREVTQLLVTLANPEPGMSVYDPTSGTGGMLLQFREHLKKMGEDPANLALFGQEMNMNTLATCKINLALHGVKDADIRLGDTLREPAHIVGKKLMTFDRVIANPPISLKHWGEDECRNDMLGRFPYGIPPKSSGDLAFVQHMLASANSNGTVAVIMSHGVLFRGGVEKEIRRAMLQDDLIEAVIGLPPALFYGTGVHTCVLIINKSKPLERKGRILFIDASEGFESARMMNRLRHKDIDLIAESFRRFESKGTFSKVVNVDEVVANDVSLNIRLYVDNSQAAQELRKLLEHHEGFEQLSLSSEKLVKSIKVVKPGGEMDVKNAVYFNRYLPEKSAILLDLKNCTSLTSSFIEVVFNENKLLNEYAKLFFESSLGYLMLRRLPVGVSVQMLQAKSIQSLSIPIPHTLVQNSVIKVASKLQIARQQIDLFFSTLTTEPKKYKVIEDNTDSMVYTLSSMSESKHAQHLVKIGETRYLEYKQSFFANVDKIYSSENKIEKNRDVQGEVIKDIASFMNTEGGTLLVGVNDDGKVTGIEREMKRFGWKKIDSYFQELGAQLESRLGKNYHQYCKLSEVIIDGKTIAMVDCKRSPHPTFMDNEKFHIRTDTSSPSLTGEAMLRYIQNHFKVTLINDQ